MVDMLHDKLMGVNNTLAFFDGELQVRKPLHVSHDSRIPRHDHGQTGKTSHRWSLRQQGLPGSSPRSTRITNTQCVKV